MEKKHISPDLAQTKVLLINDIAGYSKISLGAMIGTGAVVGVLGALSKLYASGQNNIEAMAIWALIAALIMVPVSYSETLNSKIMGKTPKEYISHLINPKLGLFYAICFVALVVFGLFSPPKEASGLSSLERSPVKI